MPKISLCTLLYSDNLGDGVISGSVKHLITKLIPSAEIEEFDLAGRSGYEQNALSKKFIILKILHSLPLLLSQMAFYGLWRLKIKPTVLPVWKKALEDSEALILGGGQLILDDYLNFPLKIHALCIMAKKKNIPVAFHAVGVSHRLSYFGRRLFAKILLHENVTYISVRDKASYQHAITHFGAAIKGKLYQTIDPAIYVSEVYSGKGEKKFIGLNIAHPMALKANAEKPENFVYQTQLEFWKNVVDLLQRKGKRIALMTNGSYEDALFQKALVEALKDEPYADDITVLPKPDTPALLVEQIMQMEALVAHRLHANIIAYSLLIPAVALVWDSKVRGFSEMTGRTDWCIDSHQMDAQAVVDSLDALQPIAIDRRNELKALSEQAFKELLERVVLKRKQ